MVRGRGKSTASSSSTDHYDDGHGSNSSKSSRNRLKVFTKRTMNLKKKMYELTTLCDLDGCLIVKGPNGELETWPENRFEVEHVLQRYMDMNEEDRHKNNKDISSFLIEKKKKLEIQIDEIRKENYSKTKSLYPTWNNKLDELSEDSLRKMQCSLESKLEDVNSRVKMKKQMMMMMMNRGDDHTATTTNTTINPAYSLKAEIFAAMGGCLNPEPQHGLDSTNYINPPLMPQAHEFFDFNSSHHRQQQHYNLLPSRGTIYDQYYTNLMSEDGNYLTNLVSLPPLPPTAIFSHDQPPVPLQTCVPAAPSFQIDDHGHFLDSMYSHHQQQQQDFGFMPINEGDTY